jgi:lipopolysaccharide/colanic/teichoic acid biosynthesis glycosyltransferase
MHVFLPYNGVFRGKSIIGNICALLVAGLTGWAQINGRDELPIPVKVCYHEYYYKKQIFFVGF